MYTFINQTVLRLRWARRARAAPSAPSPLPTIADATDRLWEPSRRTTESVLAPPRISSIEVAFDNGVVAGRYGDLTAAAPFAVVALRWEDFPSAVVARGSAVVARFEASGFFVPRVAFLAVV